MAGAEIRLAEFSLNLMVSAMPPLRFRTVAHQPAHSSNPKGNFTLVPRISAETNPINVKERPNILLVTASC